MTDIKRRHFLGVAAAAVGGAAAGVGGTLGVQAAAYRAPVYPTDGPPSAQSYLPIDPSNIQRAIAQIGSVVTDLMKRTGMPGVGLAVVHDGKIVVSQGFGLRKVGTSDSVDADSVFQIASLSKSVSATAIANAVSQNIVTWNDTVVSHLPSFTLADDYATHNVTLADVYSHRSGLPGHAGDLIEDLGFGQQAVLARLKFFPLAPIRSVYEYTNFGLTAGAEAVASATGLSFDEFVQKMLFDPLAMTSSYTTFDGYSRSPDRAWGHILVDGAWEASVVRNADAQSAAGGISASANDMARWLLLQLGQGSVDGAQIIPADQIREIQTAHMIADHPATSDSRTGLYGLGMNVGVDVSGRATLSHSGQFSTGAGANYLMMPAENLGIVALGNGMAIGLVEAVTKSFFDIVETGAVQADWYDVFNTRLFAPGYVNNGELAGKTPPADAAPFPGALGDVRALVGSYSNDLYGPARVSAAGGVFTLWLGPTPTPFVMSAWNGLVYSYLPTGENALGIAAVTFTLSAIGAAETMNLENLNPTGEGAPPVMFLRS